MYFILAVYNIIFFHKFYRNPYLLSSSELASTFFPHWAWMGKKWQTTDNIYYKYPAAIPFLSMFYPTNVFFSWVSRNLSLDNSFKIFSFHILGHYILASFIAYFMFSQWASPEASLFGALTLTYAGYCIKPNTPCFVYTMCWIPGTFIDGWFGWFSLGMSILGGYLPILVYVFPFSMFALLHQPGWWASLIAIPQIVLFLWYWRKSVRYKQKVDSRFGRLSLWKLRDLFIPTNHQGTTSGVHYPETEMYMGLMPFIFIWFSGSRFWICLLISILFVTGGLPPIQRIPARALYLMTLSISVLAVDGFLGWPFIFIQAFQLLRNSNIYPSFPFTEWWNKPSDLYWPPFDGTYPNITGYLIGEKTSEYRGAFRLAGK